MPRIVKRFLAGLMCLFAAMVLVALWQAGTRTNPRAGPAAAAELSQASSQSGVTHPVIIRQPSGPPRIQLAGSDPQGRVGNVACSACHSLRQPNLDNETAATLDEFHQGMTCDHGSIACYACHNPNDSDVLRLADGSSVAYENVMTLCSQCHGMQADSFTHGAHGGMNGHWDLGRGPQRKNNCIDCHDPHAPRYPKMIVGFKPKDRFNAPSIEDSQHEGTASHDKQ